MILVIVWCSAWDYSAWVRTYALYLEERLECFRVLKYDVETDPPVCDFFLKFPLVSFNFAQEYMFLMCIGRICMAILFVLSEILLNQHEWIRISAYFSCLVL